MNRFIVACKRIMNKRMYLVMIALLVALTTIYKLLPEKSKTTDIKVALCMEDSDALASALKQELSQAMSTYTFYYTDTRDALLADVQSGYAECGYYFPAGFFQDYIQGTGTNKVTLYETPSSTLSSMVNETLFHYIYRICVPTILTNTVNERDLDAELLEEVSYYMDSDEVFQMTSVTDGRFDFEDMTYTVELPVRELSCVFVLFTALFGLLMHMQDRERNIYLTLGNAELFGVQSKLIFAAMLPILACGLLVNLITYGASSLLYFLLVSGLSFLFATALSFVIKKSTLLTKVLPLFLLCSIAYFFLSSLV